MKKKAIMIAFLLGLSFSTTACGGNKNETMVITSEKETSSEDLSSDKKNQVDKSKERTTEEGTNSELDSSEEETTIVSSGELDATEEEKDSDKNKSDGSSKGSSTKDTDNTSKNNNNGNIVKDNDNKSTTNKEGATVPATKGNVGSGSTVPTTKPATTSPTTTAVASTTKAPTTTKAPETTTVAPTTTTVAPTTTVPTTTAPPTTVAQGRPGTAEEIAQVLAGWNQARADAGVNAMTINATWSRYAQDYASWMYTNLGGRSLVVTDHSSRTLGWSPDSEGCHWGKNLYEMGYIQVDHVMAYGNDWVELGIGLYYIGDGYYYLVIQDWTSGCYPY